MVVLSLFDGIACGYLALKRAGIPVDAYYASEIDAGAIKIAKANHEDMVEIGDVVHVRYADGVLYSEAGEFEVGEIDLVIGGSPCTNFSSIGNADGMNADGMEILSLAQYLELKAAGASFGGQSYLFWEYVRILNEVKPKHFLLENVEMANKWKEVINSALGIQPIKINSALVSAQNRPRLYWTNIEGVAAPLDMGVKLDEILMDDAPAGDVSGCATVVKCLPKLVDKYGYVPERFNAYNVREITDKACALSRGSMVTSSCATLLLVPRNDGVHVVKNGVMDGLYPVKIGDGKYNLRRLSLTEMERLQTLPDGYTNVEGVGVQKRSAAIGNGWTVEVIVHILSFLRKG